ncbi:MAG TPA: GNAT family N-acetyltransferase [Roseiflexaceae bacterium]|nr:GNAT family N-acetyltransferase [Roseiflexaceae bacterium]HMP42097.1 GNAT family N-acetyltransferase [Roseiflexaceae bacterium]
MTSTISLRPAGAVDAAALAELYITSRKAYLPYAPLAHPDEDVRQWIAEILIPGSHVVVADLHGMILGFIATSRHDGFGWIDQLYIRPGAVDQGIGSLLLRHALTDLPRPVRLYTFQPNSGARRFYERFGFTAIAYSDGHDNEERCPDVLYELAAADAAKDLSENGE